MPGRRRLLALAGLLGGVLLVQAPAAQADEPSPAPVCQQTERGYLCSENVDRTYRTPDGSVVRSQSKTAVSCTVAEPEPSANQGPQAYPQPHRDTVTECAGSPNR